MLIGAMRSVMRAAISARYSDTPAQHVWLCLILLKLLRSICRSGGPFKLLERRPDGRIVVPRAVLAQLGTGDAVRGEQLVERLIGEMRSRRVLMASRAARR